MKYINQFRFGELIPDKVPILRGLLLFGIFFAVMETENGLATAGIDLGPIFTVAIWSAAVVVWVITEAMVLLNKNRDFFGEKNRKDTFIRGRKNVICLVIVAALCLWVIVGFFSLLTS